MKSIILAITLTTFSLGAFAGDACCAKDKAACPKDKAACAGKAAAGCPMSKGKCPAGGDTAKADVKKVQSPKDAAKS